MYVELLKQAKCKKKRGAKKLLKHAMKMKKSAAAATVAKPATSWGKKLLKNIKETIVPKGTLGQLKGEVAAMKKGPMSYWSGK